MVARQHLGHGVLAVLAVTVVAIDGAGCRKPTVNTPMMSQDTSICLPWTSGLDADTLVTMRAEGDTIVVVRGLPRGRVTERWVQIADSSVVDAITGETVFRRSHYRAQTFASLLRNVRDEPFAQCKK